MKRHCTWRRTAALAAAAALATAGLARTAGAINIVLVYNAASSTEPAGDPTGAALTTIMQHVETFYQDVFEDSHTITINFWYENLGAPNLAVHNLVSQSGGRETEANIRFDPDAQGNNWYFDATPANNSEFDMGQTLWRDLSGAQRTDFYNFGANIPMTFEAGLTGSDNGSNANVAGNTDLVSVAFHEVGHALGMSGANTSTQNEVDTDGDYDYDAVNVFGVALAAEAADDTGDPNGNIAHLDSSFALMNPSVGTGIRRLPSHTDLFSMAAVHNYTDLDIPRREFYGGTNWNADANWTGNTVPSTGDEVFIRASGPANEVRSATLTAAGFAGTLTVAEGSNLNTGAFKLDVTNTLFADGVNTDVTIPAGGEIEADALVIRNSAELRPSGGLVDVNTLSTTALIAGNGTIDVQTTFTTSGTTTVSGGDLTLTTSNAAGVFNLDGASSLPLLIEPGVVNVTGGNLTVNGLLTDAFNGDLNIGNTRTATFNDPWTVGGDGGGTIILGSDGVVNLNGGTTSTTAAVLAGALVTVDGDVNVGTTNYGLVNAPVSFNADAQVLANGTLELAGSATYNGGSHTGAGRLVWDGNVTIAASTTIGMAELDFDGFVPLATVTVNDGATLTINSTITDAPSGSIVLNGTMLVNNQPSWTNDTGTVTLNSGTIGGTATFINSGDFVVAAGTSAVTTDARFNGTANPVVNGSLRLIGSATFAGGIWSGTGTFALEAGSYDVIASTTWGTANLNLDQGGGAGSINISPGVTLSLNGAVTDAFDATLNVNSGTVAANVSGIDNAGRVNLTDTGSGVARLTGLPLNNTTTGTLVFGGGTPGVASTGGLLSGTSFTNAGTVIVSANGQGAVNGATVFNATTELIVSAGGNLDLNGATTYNGGSYTGAGKLEQNGNATVAANTTIDVATYDWDGGPISNTTVNSGVTFTINSTDLEDDSNTGHDGVITVNSGTVTVNTPGGWESGGTVVLNNTAGNANIRGQQLFLNDAQVNSGGAGANLIVAPLRFSVGTVNVTASNLQVSIGAFAGNAGGVLTKIGGGQLNILSPHAHAAGATINVNAGQLLFAQDAGAGGANLNLNVNGAASFTTTASQHLAALNVGTGSLARTNGASNAQVVRTRAFTISGAAVPAGRMDVGNDTLVIDYTGASPLLTTFEQIRSAFNGGLWNGNGITTSSGDAASFGIGYAEATSLFAAFPATFAGESIDDSTVLVTFTRYGDANLDRQVNLTDFNRLASNFGLAGMFWDDGDFNYDNVVNLADFNRLAANFGLSAGADASVDPEDWAALASAVPEPGGAGLLLSATGALLARRRRCGQS